MKYIIKASPEITIKSKPVRKRAFMMLKNNIKKHFDFEEIEITLMGSWDSIELNDKNDNDRVKKILSQIAGIAYFQEVVSFDMPEFSIEGNNKRATEEIEKDIFHPIFEKTKEYYLEKLENKSFVVRIKRIGKHDFTSTELERYIGGGLLKYSNNSKVKLKGAEITVKLEVKNKKFFIIKQKTEGVGGYPIGFQDKIVSLISGGFDSGVSTYSMMKRGCEVDFLFFNLGGSAHELGVKQVSYYLWKTFSVPNKRARFISVPFEGVIKELLTKISHKYRGILLKRYMLKVASMVSKGNYYAIVKGDSLGQVSSQTLKNMHVIDKASDNLVLRPLISYNKQEIIDISKNIGTYNFACNMPEYCGVISDKPSTGAKLEKVLEEELNIDEKILEDAFESRSIEFIKDMLNKHDSLIDSFEEDESIVSTNKVLKNEIIIDVREEDKIKNSPLVIENIEILNIPFFDINHKYKDLDQNKVYLFYCDKGVLSKLHALYLKDKGFSNIKIYRES